MGYANMYRFTYIWSELKFKMTFLVIPGCNINIISLVPKYVGIDLKLKSKYDQKCRKVLSRLYIFTQQQHYIHLQPEERHFPMMYVQSVEAFSKFTDTLLSWSTWSLNTRNTTVQIFCTCFVGWKLNAL